MNTINTGRFIYELRKEKGLTQKELAENLNVTDKAVSKWETGKCAPDISLLVSLSEILGVSVVEILQGEKIKEESIQQVCDEVIVETIKKNKQKHKNIILTTVSIFMLLILLCAIHFPAYHFFNSAPADDEAAITKMAKQYISGSWKDEAEEMEIVKSIKKREFYFFLLQGDGGIAMVYFEKDELFDNRISVAGAGGISEPNEIGLYCFCHNGITINAFYGYDMTDREYSYYYRGLKCTKAIKDKLLLDVLIDVDDTMTHADLIYDE